MKQELKETMSIHTVTYVDSREFEDCKIHFVLLTKNDKKSENPEQYAIVINADCPLNESMWWALTDKFNYLMSGHPWGQPVKNGLEIIILIDRFLNHNEFEIIAEYIHENINDPSMENTYPSLTPSAYYDGLIECPQYTYPGDLLCADEVLAACYHRKSAVGIAKRDAFL